MGEVSEREENPMHVKHSSDVSAEEVKECIRYVRPSLPEDGGLQGCGMRRNVGYLLEGGSEAWASAMRDVVVEIMIESEKAVEQLDEILAVKGLDMLHFGPCDYSLSVGKVGQMASPEIKRKQREVFERALKAKVRPRVIINSFEEAREYFDMGVRDFCVGSDLGTLYRWSVLHGGKIRELISR